MSDNHHSASTHITPYRTLAIVLVVLLALTFLTIEITSFDLKAWNVALALLVACFKGYLVLSYFMHLKYENLLIKILVGMVILLFALIIVITYIDYLFR
ncbi:MAG: cytochrome C oxidase subunit IV family protein [Bacteroidales bacterium]|nr:cytochrome C oxidase subunit IV family protein [Bacteroidales bacterium]